ncbi:class E sortase [Acrocarpospora phusangensis]|uniref:Class E sortase n=1 Tax=Acrocarpospora phusangensis TaxID=1070424 RepID=A0A919Q7W2_9ACTN|nr:class E sortase [Acrocarpospora phusangensis]GIH21850.1 class E sortase [Acrocarpospora phusangensis]
MVTGQTAPPYQHRQDDDLWEPPSRRLARGAGELMVTLGVIALLFAAYAVYGKAWRIEAEQRLVDERLDRIWTAANAPSAPAPGLPLARLHIPKLDRRWAVVEGVTQADLRKGPGHYPKTARPGEIGNMAVAGHRIPSVFWDLDRLRTGDTIVAETRNAWFVYRVTGHREVLPSSVEVVAPTPNRPGVPPERAMLTLTTCNPKLQNWQRLAVFAELARSQAKTDGRPPELELKK